MCGYICPGILNRRRYCEYEGNKHIQYVEFEVPTVMKEKNAIFWNVMLCSLNDVRGHFGRTDSFTH
jgi:hypothetical protein